MNKRETNKMNSFGISEEVLLRNKPIWETDEVIKNLFGEIQLKLPLVLEYGVKQKKNGTVATVVKQTGKTSLIAHALKISVSAVSFSASQKDLVLEKEVKLIKSDLERLTQIGLYNTLSLFYKKVLPLKNSLKHLEANDIDKLKKLLDDFKTSIPQTGADKDQSQTATYNIGDLIYEINNMFIELDKHIAPYQYSQPDFFRDYQNSRKVIDLKGKSTAKSKAKVKSEAA